MIGSGAGQLNVQDPPLRVAPTWTPRQSWPSVRCPLWPRRLQFFVNAQNFKFEVVGPLGFCLGHFAALGFCLAVSASYSAKFCLATLSSCCLSWCWVVRKVRGVPVVVLPGFRFGLACFLCVCLADPGANACACFCIGWENYRANIYQRPYLFNGAVLRLSSHVCLIKSSGRAVAAAHAFNGPRAYV